MPTKSPALNFDFHQLRFTQISESHCGPAVIQMLLSHIGIEVSQEAVAEAGGATTLIELNGMRVDQLALAVRKLAPQARFWWKDRARLKDLIKAVTKYHCPVGVEWQGVFDDDDLPPQPPSLIPLEPVRPPAGFTLPDSETEDDDFGHYSIVTAIHLRSRRLIIADPYKDYIAKDRIFRLREFVSRWYDYNEVPIRRTTRKRLVLDYHMMFVVTRREESWPQTLGMKQG